MRWTETIRTLLDDEGCEAFVEIGPGNTLSNLVKRIARGTPTERVDAGLTVREPGPEPEYVL